MNNFDAAFETFLAGITSLITDHQTKINQYQSIEVLKGKRYWKITVGGVVWCFVDKTNGNVLSPPPRATCHLHEL